MEKPGAVGEERASEIVLLGVRVRALLDPVLREDVDERARIPEQDRRVRRDEELRAPFGQLVYPPHQRELAAHGERRLGLVEDVEPAAEETLEHEREERLAVRLVVQGCLAV